MEYINQQDIQKLVHEPSPSTRASIAAKISQGFDKSNFTENESKIALEIFRILLDDTAVKVRAAIADNLKNNPSVPKDIMNRLARDVEMVALPILEFSSILSDEELLEIANETNALPRLQAIARRVNLSGAVSSALIATGRSALIKELLKNNTAEIFEQNIGQVIDIFYNNKPIMEKLANRGDLPIAFAEQVYSYVSEHLRKQLVSRYHFSWKHVNKATELVRNTSIIGFLSTQMNDEELYEMIVQMHNHKRLNYSLVLRALCMGELRFFEMSLSVMANISIDKVRLSLQNSQNNGFSAIFQLCNIPIGFEDATCAIYHVIKETSASNYSSKIDFQCYIVECLIDKGYHITVENMSYFISIMRQQIYGGAVIH